MKVISLPFSISFAPFQLEESLLSRLAWGRSGTPDMGLDAVWRSPLPGRLPICPQRQHDNFGAFSGCHWLIILNKGDRTGRVTAAWVLHSQRDGAPLSLEWVSMILGVWWPQVLVMEANGRRASTVWLLTHLRYRYLNLSPFSFCPRVSCHCPQSWARGSGNMGDTIGRWQPPKHMGGDWREQWWMMTSTESWANLQGMVEWPVGGHCLSLFKFCLPWLCK